MQMVLVDHFDLVVGPHVGAGDRAAAVLLDADDARLLAVVLHHQRLDVEHDVGDVLDHAGQGGEFVLGAVQLDLRDRAAFQAGQEDAPQAVADGHAEAALEGLGDELAVGGRTTSIVPALLDWATQVRANEYASVKSPVQ